MSFYDDDWRRLQAKFPLIAKKIEEVRCDSVSYEQYEDETKELAKRIEGLQKQVNVLNRQVNILLKLNGLKKAAPLAAT